MHKSRKGHQQYFLLSTFLVNILLISLLIGQANAKGLQDLIVSSQKFKNQPTIDNRIQDQIYGTDSSLNLQNQNKINLIQTKSSPFSNRVQSEQNLSDNQNQKNQYQQEDLSNKSQYSDKYEQQKTSVDGDQGADNINLLQTDSTPLSRLRMSMQKQNQQNDVLLQTAEKQQIDIPDVIPLTQTAFSFQDNKVIQPDQQLLKTIQENLQEQESSSHKIEDDYQSLSDEFEKLQKEEEQKNQKNDYLQQLHQSLNLDKTGNSFYSIDDDVKKVIKPQLLNDVVSQNKQHGMDNTLLRLQEEQRKREYEAFLKNQKLMEEEKLKADKIKEKLMLEAQKEKEQIQARRKQIEEEQQRKREEERRIYLAEEAQKLAEQQEEEREREEAERQAEIDRQQEADRVRQHIAELEAQHAAELEEEERQEALKLAEEQTKRYEEEQRAVQEQEQQRIEAERQQELRVQEQMRQEEEQRRKEEEELRRQEQEALRQQQIEEAEYRRQQEIYEKEQQRLEEEKKRLDEEQKKLEQEEEQKDNQLFMTVKNSAQQQQQQQVISSIDQIYYIDQNGQYEEMEDQQYSLETQFENDEGDNYSSQNIITQDRQQTAFTANQNKQILQNDNNNADKTSNEQSLKDIEDRKRQQLREQKEQAKRAKESQTTFTSTANINGAAPSNQGQSNKSNNDDIPKEVNQQQVIQSNVAEDQTQISQNNQNNGSNTSNTETFEVQTNIESSSNDSQVQNIEEDQNNNSFYDSDEYITQVDEFGKEYKFKKAKEKIPLVLPGGQTSDSSVNYSLAGMKLQAKIIQESGHHLDKNSIKEQREKAEKFQFIASKTRSSQVTPKGDKIENKDNGSSNKQFSSTPIDSSTLASNVAILCNDKNKLASKSVQHVCELCEVGEVFQLTDENWFKVGLAHNHKKEYQDLLNQVNDVFGKLNLIAGFSNHGDICFASDQIFNPVNIDLTLKTFTYNSLSQYQLKNNPIFNFQQQYQIDEFSFRTSFNKEKRNGQEVLVPEYNNFQMIINGQFFRKIDSSTNLNILNVVFLQSKLTTFYFGQISINSYSSQIHFQHDIDDREHETISILTELPADSITFQRQAFKMFSQDNLQKIVQGMQLDRGVQNIENVKISQMLVTLNLKANSYQVIMNYDEIVDFSLSLNLDLKGCFGWIMIQKDSANNQFYLESNSLICQVEQFPQYCRLNIKKTNTNTLYFLRFADDEYLLKQVDQEILYKINDSSLNANKFEESLNGLIDFNRTYLHQLNVQIFFEPKIIYEAQAKVGGKDFKTIGEFKAKLTRINGRINTFASFTFGAENVSNLFKVEKSDLVSTVPKSLYIFYSEQDLNVKDLPYLSKGAFGPLDQQQWSQGPYIQYVFDLEDNCNVGKFLNYHKTEVKNLHLKGYFKDQFIQLSGPIETKVNVAAPITLENIYLNVAINLNGQEIFSGDNLSKVENLSKIQHGRLYLSAEFRMQVQESVYIQFQSILNYQNDGQGYLLAESPQPWDKAFDKENLLLSEVMFKGNLNEDLYRIQSFTINSLSMFGDNCFVELATDPVPRFVSNKCFFGNSQIKVNFKDYSQNLFVSYINQINPQNILQVLMGYNQVQFATTVSKAISSMEFPKGLAMTYTKQNIKDSSGSIHIPKGFTLTGHAQLLGLKGHVVLNVNQDKYMLGIFKFDELTLAGGNIVIVETEGTHQNNIILRLQKDSPNLTEIDQVFFNPRAFIFNLQRSIQISVTKESGYVIEALDKFFGCENDIAIRLTAPFNLDIQQSQFKLVAMFTPQHLKRINQVLMNLTKEWMNKTQQLFIDLAQRVSEVQKDLISLNRMLCDKETCPYHQQCVGNPRSECVKYHQKQVCVTESVICLEEKIVCSLEQQICSETAITCTQFSATDPTICENYQESCVQQITKCNQYTSICVSEEIKVCTKNQYVDDTERCIERQMVCDVEQVKDTNCQEECERKKEEFELKSIIFEKFTNALNNFQRRNSKFSEMVNYSLENEDSFVSIIEGKFEQTLNQFVNEQTLSVNFNVKSFTIVEKVGQDIQTYIIDRYDFTNEELMIRNLFKQMQQYWASKHSIDDILISQDSNIQLHNILNKINKLAQSDAESEEMIELLQLGANQRGNFSKTQKKDN
ncbi:hypothetical protein ABPG72_004233 [Tetrahymena utriculariae]